MPDSVVFRTEQAAKKLLESGVIEGEELKALSDAVSKQTLSNDNPDASESLHAFAAQMIMVLTTLTSTSQWYQPLGLSCRGASAGSVEIEPPRRTYAGWISGCPRKRFRKPTPVAPI